MHIPYEPQVLFIPTCLANSAFPLLNRLQNPQLDPRGPHRRPLREPPNKLIEKFLRADLQLERVSAVLHADVEEAERQQGHVGVPVVDIVDDRNGGLARRITLLGVYEVRDLEIERQVRLKVLGRAGLLDEALERGGTRVAGL